ELLDVGCGTGRITLELQRMGARAVGVDFSSAAVQAASKESVAKEPPIRFMVGDIARPPLPFDNESFDATVAVGCLAVACKDLASLEQALRELARLTKKSGAIVLLEPIHSSRLLGRVLRASVADWLQAADRAGLQLVARRGMGFIPIRLAMSSFDLPRWMVKPVFRAGENALESLPLQRLADYSLLGFRHAYR
ncbi:MAG TPA: class I SAM-dependent methyltransferase, partial [Polyangiaceae bacterium]|nr:class I SAM-dependent methyltransferase [Polyangiaceae bacterium]